MDPRRQLELVHALKEKQSQRSLREYLGNLVIESSPEPRPFAEIAEPWQWQAVDRLVPIFETIMGYRTDYNGPMLAWEGMPKGHNKSGQTASLLNGVLAFTKKKGLRTYVMAKDAEQAGVLHSFMVRQAELNPWVGKRIEFKKNSAEGKETGSVVQILAADASGSQGKLPDCIVADELSAWPSDKGKDVWDALFTSVGKRIAHGKLYCACIVLTNAGWKGTWQFDLRNEAERSQMWSFYEAPPGRTMASWQTPELLDVLKRGVSPSESKRLYGNIWVDLTEDRGAFRESDIDQCIGKPLPVPKGATAVIGVDFGGVCDRTAMCVTWFDGQRIHVPKFSVWQGSPTAEIKVAAVAEWVDSQLKKYPKAVVVFDVHQLLETVQRLEARGVNVVRMNWKAGRTNVTMLQHLRTLLSNKKLVYAEDCGDLNGETLVSELKTVITRTNRMGERFDHDSGLHDDRTSALGMACMEAVKYPPTVPMTLGKTVSNSPGPLRNQVNSIFSQDHLANRGLYGAG